MFAITQLAFSESFLSIKHGIPAITISTEYAMIIQLLVPRICTATYGERRFDKATTTPLNNLSANCRMNRT